MFSPGSRLTNHNGHIHPFEHGETFLYASLTEIPDVVNTGRVHKNDRTDRRKLECFFHRISGGSCYAADDGNILIGKCINERGLAGIALTKKAEVQS